MGELRWQWSLANRGEVTATIDEATNAEVVRVGKQILSQAPRGGLTDGHRVLVSAEHDPALSERPPIEAVITFDPSSPIAILRVDGHEVAPTVWPVRKKAPLPPPPQPIAWGRFIMVAIGVVALVAVGFTVKSLRGDPTPPAPSGKMTGVHRALNGLFVAHYPPELEAKMPVMGFKLTGVQLEDKTKAMTIVISALLLDGDLRDPWSIQKAALPEVLASVPKGIGKWEESARKEDTCLGRPGAIVTGQVMERGTRIARTWSCAFVNENAGYLVLTMLLEPVRDPDEKMARSIIEATELTRLSDMGGMPGMLPSPSSSAEIPELKLPQ